MADAAGHNPGDPGYDARTDPYAENKVGTPPPVSPAPGSLPAGTSIDSNGVLDPDALAGGPGGPTPPATTTGAPHGGSLTDRNYVASLVQYYGSQPGADPSLLANPDYWIGKIMSGELGTDEGYIIGKMQNAWKGGTDTRGGMVGSYSALTRPDAVASPYVPATWDETYKVPSVTDLLADPGYQSDAASVQRALEHSAAAKGTVLDGGFVGRALPRAMADFTSNAYTDLNTRNFQAYQSRYNQFLNANNAQLGARQLNESDYNADVTNNLNQYLTRYGAYQDLIKNNLAFSRMGLDATTAGAPTLTGTGAA